MSEVRILIIEDEPIIARNLQQMLTAKGYSVVGMAYDDLQAMDKLAKKDMDLILLDINLNGQFEGLNIARLIFQEYKKPFIFITSYADDDTLSKAKQYRPSGYLVKPFEDREIYAAIEVAWHNYKEGLNQVASLKTINSRLDEAISKTEYQVLKKLIDGQSYQQIADAHFVSLNTINSHVKKLYAKLGVHRRMDAVKRIEDMR